VAFRNLIYVDRLSKIVRETLLQNGNGLVKFTQLMNNYSSE